MAKASYQIRFPQGINKKTIMEIKFEYCDPEFKRYLDEYLQLMPKGKIFARFLFFTAQFFMLTVSVIVSVRDQWTSNLAILILTYIGLNILVFGFRLHKGLLRHFLRDALSKTKQRLHGKVTKIATSDIGLVIESGEKNILLPWACVTGLKKTNSFIVFHPFPLVAIPVSAFPSIREVEQFLEESRRQIRVNSATKVTVTPAAS